MAVSAFEVDSTMASSGIVGKKTLLQRASMSTSGTSGKFSSFATKQMEKMGWEKGKGLGKNGQGIAEHVKVQKREENLGLGAEKKENWQDQWWFNVYNKVAAKVIVPQDSSDEEDSRKKAKKEKKKLKRKREDDRTDSEDPSLETKDSSSGDSSDDRGRKKKKSKKEKKAKKEKKKPKAPPTFEELFKATGGVRIGRRAYAPSKGKWERDAIQTAKFDSSQGFSSIEVEFAQKKSTSFVEGTAVAEKQTFVNASSGGTSETEETRMEATKTVSENEEIIPSMETHKYKTEREQSRAEMKIKEKKVKRAKSKTADGPSSLSNPSSDNGLEEDNASTKLAKKKKKDKKRHKDAK